jgi:hypothetical protein
MLLGKKYHYFLDNKWYGPVSYFTLSGLKLDYDTLVWWPAACKSGHKSPIECDHHKTPLWIIKREHNNTFRNVCILILFLATELMILPYIFKSKGSVKHEKINTELNFSFDDLKIKLKTGMETDYVAIDRIPNHEIVKGRPGDYYLINIKNSRTSDKIYFQAGEFTIPDLDENFVTSLRKFMTDVYGKVNNKVACQLYAKGSADHKGQETFKKYLDSYYGDTLNFKEIEYLPKIDRAETQFSPELTVQSIPTVFTNSDLPNLRGKFIQCKIARTYTDISPPIILEGSVNDKDGEAFRNAYLIMYVNWADTLQSK